MADFRDWLAVLPQPAAVVPPCPVPVDMHTLVAQFTALRHEVNLQTKASRAALEQNALALKQLEQNVEVLRDADTDDDKERDEAVRPLIKAIVDVYDALALAGRQIEKQKATIWAGATNLVEASTIEPPPAAVTTAEKPGFWARFFGASAPAPANVALAEWLERTTNKLKEQEQTARQASSYLKDAVDGLLTGYAMSLSRIDRVLSNFGVEAMTSVGTRFNPEMMEVVEAVPNSGRPLGEVLEEVRRGYRWNGSLFRYAQVRVAR